MYFPEIYVIITVHLYIETVKDRTSALSKRKHSFTGDIILDSSKTVEIRQEVSDIEKLYDASDKLVAEIEKVVIGKRDVIVMLMTALLASGHVLIEDVPGVGKTTLAAALAKAAGLSYKRAQFTPDVMASDITGYNIYNRQKEEFEFRQGLVMCNLMLADEINRASPKTQSALLEAMEENKVTLDAVENVISADDIRRIKDGVSDIRIDGELYRYIVSLVGATRKHGSLALGASPRASVALMKLSQAYAFIRGRSYVLPDDIAAIFRPAIGHRLMLKQDARLKGTTADEVLGEILRSTDVPYKGRRQ